MHFVVGKKMQVYTRMVNWDVTYYLNVTLGLKIILVL
jgi:hypothetical protein